MNLGDYARLLRRRWRSVALCTLLGLAAAVAVTLTAQKQYTSATQLFVSARDGATGTSDIGTAYTGGLFTQQRVKSYTSVLTSQHVGELVREDLGLKEGASAVAAQISASAPLDTVLLDVKVTDNDPHRAQQIATSVGRIFPQLIDELEAPANGGISPVRVSVVQAAELPSRPTSPRTNLNVAFGLLVGLAVGVGGAVARETLDASVKSPGQARALSGSPVIGAITYDPDASKHPLVVASSPHSPRSEAFRQLRTNLQFVEIDHPLRSVVVTSSVSDEGKSTTTCNLAIALAESGMRVVLVEADLRRPRVAEYLGLEGAVGLTSVLLGRTDLDTALQPWGVGSLSVLASGPLPPNPSELLGSRGMQQLLAELESRADLVLIDAPPLLPVTDAAVLGTLTSGVVLLIRSNKTRREQVARAAEILRGVGAVNLGTILNRVPAKGPDAYAYGYGYGYGNGSSAHGLAQLSAADVADVGPLRLRPAIAEEKVEKSAADSEPLHPPEFEDGSEVASEPAGRPRPGSTTGSASLSGRSSHPQA